MKISILLMMILMLGACQGRDMPELNTIKTALKEENSIHTSTKLKTIPRKKEPKKNATVLKKNILNNRHKKIVPKIMVTLDREEKMHKRKTTPVIKASLPALPIIPSIDEITTSKKSTISTTQNKTESIANTLISTKVPLPKKTFTGGGMAENLDMANIRIGNSSDYTSIIFDSYIDNKSSSLPSKKAPITGTYLFTYEPSKNRIVGILDGYNAYSALSGDISNILKSSPVLKNIYVQKYLGSDGIKFIIELHAKVRVNIFDVKNPGRIIVNLFPL